MSKTDEDRSAGRVFCIALGLELEFMLNAGSLRNESPPSPAPWVGMQDLPFGSQQVSGDSFFLPPCEGKVLQVSPLTTDLVMQLQRRQDNCQWMFWQSVKPTASG